MTTSTRPAREHRIPNLLGNHRMAAADLGGGAGPAAGSGFAATTDPFRLRLAQALPLLGRSLVEDARAAWRHLWLERLAGSPLTPRVLRFFLYRLSGLQIATANIWPRCTIIGRQLEVGRGTFINQRCFFEAGAPVRIGAGCQIGMEVMVVTSHHAITSAGAAPVPSYREVRIGDGVWLGARVLVLPGVRIADGAVVAAGAVVAGDLTEAALYAGVPARRIRSLREPGD